MPSKHNHISTKTQFSYQNMNFIIQTSIPTSLAKNFAKKKTSYPDPTRKWVLKVTYLTSSTPVGSLIYIISMGVGDKHAKVGSLVSENRLTSPTTVGSLIYIISTMVVKHAKSRHSKTQTHTEINKSLTWYFLLLTAKYVLDRTWLITQTCPS